MTPESIPSSADLCQTAISAAEWPPIGPSVLNAIIKCVEDVRRRVERRHDVNPAAMLIQYGQQVIAGTAPIAAQPGQDPGRWCVDPQELGHPAQTPMIDSPTAFGFAILEQLKASLATGQPFFFLFLRGAENDHPPVSRRRGDASETDDFAGQAHTATAIGYDDAQQAFMVVKRAAECTQPYDFTDIMLLSYAYVTHPLLSQDVWTIRTVS